MTILWITPHIDTIPQQIINIFGVPSNYRSLTKPGGSPAKPAPALCRQRRCARRIHKIGMFRLKGCVKCGGDLFLEYGDWHCLQCGKYYYTTAPWSYDGRREGGWANVGRALGRRARLEAGPPEK